MNTINLLSQESLAVKPKKNAFSNRLWEICKRGDGMYYSKGDKRVYIIAPGFAESGTWNYDVVTKNLRYQMSYSFSIGMKPIEKLLPMLKPKEVLRLIKNDKPRFLSMISSFKPIKERIFAFLESPCHMGLRIAHLFGVKHEDIVGNQAMFSKIVHLGSIANLLKAVGVNRRQRLVQSVVDIGLKKTLKKHFRRFSSVFINSFIRTLDCNKSSFFLSHFMFERHILKQIKPHWEFDATTVDQMISLMFHFGEKGVPLTKEQDKKLCFYARKYKVEGLNLMEVVAEEQRRLHVLQEGNPAREVLFDRLPWHLPASALANYHHNLVRQIEELRAAKRNQSLAQIHNENWKDITPLPGIKPLVKYLDFKKEGDEMHHCIASYFQDGRFNMFAHLETKGEKATVQISLHNLFNGKSKAKIAQLYGPCNQKVGDEIQLLAEKLCSTIEKDIVLEADIEI